MTTGTNPDLDPGARRRAAGLLDVPENASAVEVRRAYLRELRECDFVPSEPLHHALGVLNGQRASVELEEEWLLEEEVWKRAEVESFASEFFSLPPAQRRERWEALLLKCESVPPLTARLQALKAGLAVENHGVSLDKPFHRQLAEHLLHSFPLPYLARTTSRQAFLRRIEDPLAAGSHSWWEKAARYLQSEWPALAALDGELVEQVANLHSRLMRRHKMRQRNQRQQPASTDGSGGKAPWWLVWICVGMLSTGVRALFNSNPSPSSQTPSSRSSAPQKPWRDGLDEEKLQKILTARKEVTVPSDMADAPPMDELLDPVLFDVERVNPWETRIGILRFTPRPGPQANKRQQLVYGEAMLRLLGVSQQQMMDLYARAAAKNPPEKIFRPNPEAVEPPLPRSSPDGDRQP